MSQLNQQIGIERVIQNLDEPMDECQFRALCAALRIVNEEVLEWGLDELSACGLLIDDQPYPLLRSLPDPPFRVTR